MLVFELELLLVVLFVAVLLPVVLVCAPLVDGDAGCESLPVSSAHTALDANNAETVKAMIVLFIEYLAGLVKRR